MSFPRIIYSAFLAILQGIEAYSLFFTMSQSKEMQEFCQLAMNHVTYPLIGEQKSRISTERRVPIYNGLIAWTVS